MLKKDQIEAIERSTMTQIRENYWGGIKGHEARSIVDDIRHKVVEEGWYGKSVSGSLNEAGRVMSRPPVHNVAGTVADSAKLGAAKASDIYGKASQAAGDKMASLYGAAQEGMERGTQKMSDLYGQASETAENKMESLYGTARELADEFCQETAELWDVSASKLSDLYGEGSNQEAKHSDVYGEDLGSGLIN